MFKLLLVFSLLSVFSMTAQKVYVKNYFDNQTMKSEGWTLNNQKNDYWYYYYDNGKKKEEGHFEANKKVDWWLFYDENESVNRKCQLKNNQKNGYCLLYNGKKLIRAEKYKNGEKIGEWTDLKSFKKENSIWDLQR